MGEWTTRKSEHTKDYITWMLSCIEGLEKHIVLHIFTSNVCRHFLIKKY